MHLKFPDCSFLSTGRCGTQADSQPLGRAWSGVPDPSHLWGWRPPVGILREDCENTGHLRIVEGLLRLLYQDFQFLSVVWIRFNNACELKTLSPWEVLWYQWYKRSEQNVIEPEKLQFETSYIPQRLSTSSSFYRKDLVMNFPLLGCRQHWDLVPIFDGTHRVPFTDGMAGWNWMKLLHKNRIEKETNKNR